MESYQDYISLPERFWPFLVGVVRVQKLVEHVSSRSLGMPGDSDTETDGDQGQQHGEQSARDLALMEDHRSTPTKKRLQPD